MSKEKPLVLYAIVCKDGHIEACPENKAAVKRVLWQVENGICGPHRIIKLQEVRSR